RTWKLLLESCWMRSAMVAGFGSLTAARHRFAETTTTPSTSRRRMRSLLRAIGLFPILLMCSRVAPPCNLKKRTLRIINLHSTRRIMAKDVPIASRPVERGDSADDRASDPDGPARTRSSTDGHGNHPNIADAALRHLGNALSLHERVPPVPRG